MIWFVFLFCWLFRDVNNQLLLVGATVGGVMLGLVFEWLPLCEFSLFDTPYLILIPGLVLWYSRVFKSVLPLQRLGV